jgi:hypothetical protein
VLLSTFYRGTPETFLLTEYTFNKSNSSKKYFNLKYQYISKQEFKGKGVQYKPSLAAGKISFYATRAQRIFPLLIFAFIAAH